MVEEAPAMTPGPVVDLWGDAYTRVEAYFGALRIRNKLLLSRLVFRVLDRASVAYAATAGAGIPTELAMKEADRLVDEWFRTVMDEPVTGGRPRLSARGRLALFLAGMPERWQDQFLAEPPWPDDFVRTMRESYLQAGPEFHGSQMVPRPIDLGAVGVAALTFEKLSRYPTIRLSLFWLLCAGLLAGAFYLTR